MSLPPLDSHRRRRMREEDREETFKRLYYLKPPPPDDESLAPKRTMRSEQVDSMVERLTQVPRRVNLLTDFASAAAPPQARADDGYDAHHDIHLSMYWARRDYMERAYRTGPGIGGIVSQSGKRKSPRPPEQPRAKTANKQFSRVEKLPASDDCTKEEEPQQQEEAEELRQQQQLPSEKPPKKKEQRSPYETRPTTRELHPSSRKSSRPASQKVDRSKKQTQPDQQKEEKTQPKKQPEPKPAEAKKRPTKAPPKSSKKPQQKAKATAKEEPRPTEDKKNDDDDNAHYDEDEYEKMSDENDNATSPEKSEKQQPRTETPKSPAAESINGVKSSPASSRSSSSSRRSATPMYSSDDESPTHTTQQKPSNEQKSSSDEPVKAEDPAEETDGAPVHQEHATAEEKEDEASVSDKNRHADENGGTEEAPTQQQGETPANEEGSAAEVAEATRKEDGDSEAETKSTEGQQAELPADRREVSDETQNEDTSTEQKSNQSGRREQPDDQAKKTGDDEGAANLSASKNGDQQDSVRDTTEDDYGDDFESESPKKQGTTTVPTTAETGNDDVRREESPRRDPLDATVFLQVLRVDGISQDDSISDPRIAAKAFNERGVTLLRSPAVPEAASLAFNGRLRATAQTRVSNSSSVTFSVERFPEGDPASPTTVGSAQIQFPADLPPDPRGRELTLDLSSADSPSSSAKLSVRIAAVYPVSSEEQVGLEKQALCIRIKSATGLANRDWIGKSDPYCILRYDGEIILRTATEQDTLAPKWDPERSTATLSQLTPTQKLTFRVFDDDGLNLMADERGDSLGQAEITVAELAKFNGGEAFLELVPSSGVTDEKLDGSLGSLAIEVDFFSIE